MHGFEIKIIKKASIPALHIGSVLYYIFNGFRMGFRSDFGDNLLTFSSTDSRLGND